MPPIEATTYQRNIETVHAVLTENHEDNQEMLAVNRKLWHIFTTPEFACVKRF